MIVKRSRDGLIILRHVAPQFGEVATRNYRMFRKGEAYSITIKHLGTDPHWTPPSDYPGKSDYDWDARINSLPTTLVKETQGEGTLFAADSWIVDNRQGLLGVNDQGELEPVSKAVDKTANLLPVEFITPAGDPVNKPVDALPNKPYETVKGQNEFEFNSDSPGVLKMDIEAHIGGPDEIVGTFINELVFELDSIGSSQMQWVNPTDGKPKLVGNGTLTAKVKFTGLPHDNSSNGLTDFGPKKIRLKKQDQVLAEQAYEVFFPIYKRDAQGIILKVNGRNIFADNHPEPSPSQGVRPPNWFNYWSRFSNVQHFKYEGFKLGLAGSVNGIGLWSYDSPTDMETISIYEGAYNDGQQYQCGTYYSGIDWFLANLLHEDWHVTQIHQFNQLVPTGTTGTPWRYGWSWNQTISGNGPDGPVLLNHFHNHWALSQDGKPGLAGIDDDQDGYVDNLKESGPGELGLLGDAYGNTPIASTDRDIDLKDHSANDVDWPASRTKPNPFLAIGRLTNKPSEIESETVNHTNQIYPNDNTNAGNDWASPGKNHKIINAYSD